ncbi:MAG: hypothetical protein K2X00_15475 [Nitrospiraceae bacterium]|jgi:hypothetical protein|nr:hypothetical protein [Nitrospiraceae bacterium]OQW65331.1 MAG: hypothetical protein BVN29_09975 [Nitrospira sp. ST-bin5]
MTRTLVIAAVVLMGVTVTGVGSVQAQEDQLAYAVVSEAPRDKSRISAKIAIEGTVTDTKLLASEAIVGNLIWKKLEICHAMRLEGQRSGEGFRVTSVRVVDGSMLPMVLQGFAGDCLLKKALEIAPLVD